MSGWRVILTDSEALSGIAPICPRQTEPGGPHDVDPDDDHGDDEATRYDTASVYDCCPHPHIETWGEYNARDVVALLNQIEAEVCT